MEDSKHEPEQEKKWDQRIRLLIGVVVVLWLITGAIIWCIGKFNGSGEFGDTYGILNTLFSGLAFAILIYTANMKREELALQREELTLTREELRKSAEAQNAILEHQRMVRRSQIRPSFAFQDHILSNGTIIINIKLKDHSASMISVRAIAPEEVTAFFTYSDFNIRKRPNEYIQVGVRYTDHNTIFAFTGLVIRLELTFRNEDDDVLRCVGDSAPDASMSSMTEPKICVPESK